MLLLGVSIAQGNDLFETRVRPVLMERCAGCHGASETSGLRVDSRERLLRGGKRGPAVIAGKPDASLLLAAVRGQSLQMPPAGRLSDAEIGALETWVRDGAVWPVAVSAVQSSGVFWSFEPLRPVTGSIDTHVRAGLNGIAPNPRADRRTLIRRLYADLTGLPPSPFEGTIEQLVDRLLASPQFGERWGRHWLDVARFGEDDFSGTAPKPYPNAWRYRDWVIDAFNNDMPYDMFVRAQLAADLMPGDNKKYIGGLGLFGFGPWYYGITQPPQARADERHDRVDVVTRGFLGLTAACARCHDHKYDPIPQKDYYALSGVFASSEYKEYPLVDDKTREAYEAAQKRIKNVQKEIDAFIAAQRDSLAEIYSRQTAAFLMGRAGLDADVAARWKEYLKKPEEDFPFLKPWLASKSEADAQQFQDLLLAVVEEKRAMDDENKRAVIRGTAPDEKRRKIILPGNYDSEADFNPGSEVVTKSLDRERYQLWQKMIGRTEALYRLDEKGVEKRLTGEWKRHLDGLRAELVRLKKASPPPYPYHQGLTEHTQPIDLPLDLRGDPTRPGEIVPRHFLTSLSNGREISLREGSGRAQLAEAIVAHPLAARVMANRIWAWLFGAGVVRTPSNFGLMGERPANRALLEYLAARFAALQFSPKALIREIVLSETYQASSAAAQNADPDNRLFWRANRKRLDAESIRDAILAVSGELDSKVGGESSELSDSNVRRTVYVRVGRYQQNETLALFDFPSTSVHVEKRAVTNVPLQKLFFLNSRFFRFRSEALAQRAECAATSIDERVALLHQWLFQRAPSSEEAATAREFLRDSTLPQYAQVLLSTNEFLYVD